MKIKKSVLARLDNPRGHALVMLTLEVSHSTARDYIQNNKDDLTKAAMLRVIREEFKLTDKDILEETNKPKTAV